MVDQMPLLWVINVTIVGDRLNDHSSNSHAT